MTSPVGRSNPPSLGKDNSSEREVELGTEDEKSSLYRPEVDTSNINERKLIRKLDWRTIPWPALLYLFCFLDRSSIGNARLYNMEKDLNITDTQYLLALTIFFFSFAAFELPSNLMLRRLKPSVWFSTLMVFWGIAMTTQGLVHNYGGLMTVRWWVGAFEAGIYPGVNYYLSCWYKRSEFGLRASIFFSAATVSGAFGGLLAVAIAEMDGLGGKAGWAWIFIIEGLATIVLGILSFWIIVDFPNDAKFLTEAEQVFVIRRLQEDKQMGVTGENFDWKAVKQSLSDPYTYLGIVIFAGSGMPLYAFSLFLPSIISEVRYKATPANLLTVPVYVMACIFTCGVSYLADRYGNRGWWNFTCLSISAAGYIILIASRNATLSYVAVYLSASGIYPCISNTMAWVGNNVEGTYKRSVTMAMVVSLGILQGAVSSNVYRANQTPWYPLGHGIVLMYIGIGLVSTLWYIIVLKMENARRDRGERDEIINGIPGGHEVNGRFATVEDARREKGDRWSGFRYTL
ncbi:MFS general substrate transporter [Coniophora puteana RWD-64-598 SS2]|uniref:MFS general substrate transporter n=1 Tax=Coniophora puteana (strain RWD-64-598) TaxID=741705 RepID=A0A5M3MPB6_CONPW|nr:MFS general substrate transporter [Coniophora puteana RWD-64-598 SS2]EIW80461.1 MFS general substrate transporter [Coniophora puteana RWD-64-598 SS2]